jgi:putative PIG3 family NAD(P)H quinone oxidoreductase
VRAIAIEKRGGPEVLKLVQVPDPVAGPEDLVVRVRATALNRADLLQRRGLYPQPGPATAVEIPGLEYAGEVERAGERCEGFQPGDRVFGILTGGGYAEKVVVHHRLAARVPGGLSWPEAAAVPEAFMTAADALEQCGLRAGESVLVHAVGSGVGGAVIQLAAVAGATPILGTARTADKLSRARELGLTTGWLADENDFAAAVLDYTKKAGVDVIVDFVGASYLERNVRALAVKGRMIVVGMLGGINADLSLAALLAKRLRIIGTVLRSRPLEERIAATRLFEKSVVPHLASGRVRPVIDRTFALDQSAEAHRYMETNANYGKIVLTV